MDYSIAVLSPSKLIAETSKNIVKRLGYDYPVYAASTQQAVDIANKLIPKGLRIVISHGLTGRYITAKLPISVMELPFSGLETLKVIKYALRYDNKKIVHIGTSKMYHYIQQSLKYLSMDPNTIYFCELGLDQLPADRAAEMIEAGYDILIGGYTTVEYAKAHGKIGVEFDTDELIIEDALSNARTVLNYMKDREELGELDRALLQSSSDGIMAVDTDHKIFRINPAAAHIFKKNEEELLNKNLNDVLKWYNIFDIHNSNNSINDIKALDSDDTTPVFLQEIPVMVRGEKKGSVINIKKVSDIQEMDIEVQKKLADKGLVAKSTFSDIIGECVPMRQAKKRAQMYARYESSILIYGETGTGKELFAQSIHNASTRRHRPFVAINCAALPENLIESELFGYVKGAFTGAVREGKQGLFELANHGTIFLDEISEIPISVQSKLLRVLQDGEFLRVGGDQIIKVDVRVISSSNKDLLSLIDKGQFKEDLYYRLSVLEVDVPPLRERREDIELLANNLMFTHAVKNNKIVNSIAPEVLEQLKNMEYRGNVRELSNIIERMVILSTSTEIDMETFLQSDIRNRRTIQQSQLQTQQASVQSTAYASAYSSDPAFRTGHDSSSAAAYSSAAEMLPPHSGGTDITSAKREAEISRIKETLSLYNGSRSRTAEALGINPSTLWRKMKAYGLNDL